MNTDCATIINALSCFFSLILSAISIITVVITLRQNHKMIENATRPYISVYGQEVNCGSPAFYIVIKNYGSSPAIINHFKIDPDISHCYRSDKSRDFLSDLSTCVLAPGQSKICAMDYMKLPDSLSFDIQFSSGSKSYHECFKSNIKAGSAMPILKAGPDNDLHSISYTLQEMLQKQL